ncbi:hypothetical protein CEUSTIGMA_g13627.t1 [Chlamydomonas eustigma]|uniref:Major facilitator superfamily associated domain-containing protein n=1 Tax=Chlamydomonas eustigma TaxID=1157962 RepID=A0A250XT19_9CHLO|nr:hypothetical protein CEUSTIGMA_g13627.t1 [Chlamydomonas eustigma]|eukprot:GAX86214.1 hypothetical protein CEUSTIGMA_g13627.t1 [Chlamydomonas eustigma]
MVRLLLPAVTSFWAVLAVIVTTEVLGSPVTIMVLGSPVTIMADTAVTSSCTEEGEYGKYRLWGAIGWGVMSSVAGVLMDQYGIGAAFAANLILTVPFVYLGLFLWRSNESKSVREPSLTELTARKGHGVASSHSRDKGHGVASSHSRDKGHGVASSHSRDKGHGVASSHSRDKGHGVASSHSRDKSCPPSSSYGHGKEKVSDGGLRVSLKPEEMTDDVDLECAVGPVIDECKQGERHAAPEHLRLHRQILKRAADHAVDDALGDLRGEQNHESENDLMGSHDVNELSFWSKLRLIFGQPQSLVFFWTATVMGFGFGVIEGYLFLMLKDLGAKDFLLGLTLTVTCAAEVPIFRYQGELLRLLGGPDALLDLCLCAYVVRMLAYAGLPVLGSPWLVLPIELLHGLTFACGWGAGCEKSKALAPPGLEATQQGLFQALYFGLGYGTGSLVGGAIATRFGFQIMYIWGACIVAAGWILARLGRWVASNYQLGTIGYVPVRMSD